MRRAEREVAHRSRACHHVHYPLGRLYVSAYDRAWVPGVKNRVLIDSDLNRPQGSRVKRRVFARETLKTVQNRGGGYAQGGVKASFYLLRTSSEVDHRRTPAYFYLYLYRYMPRSRSVVFKVVSKDIIAVRYFLYGAPHESFPVVKEPGSGLVYFRKRIFFEKLPHPLLPGIKRGYLRTKIPFSFLMIPGREDYLLEQGFTQYSFFPYSCRGYYDSLFVDCR